MIKLFWNTHNQTAPGPKEINTDIARNYKWGIYHRDNSNKWIYQILEKIEYSVIENETSLEKEDTLIIVDSGIEQKVEFYAKLKLICSKIFLFHLGD